MSPRSAADDSGSAVVGFVLVSLLTTVVFLGVLQLALVLHVRTTLVDCAAEGARYGALADRTPADGAARARELVTVSLSPRLAEHVEGSRTVLNGLDVVRVEIIAPLPVLGVLGPAGLLRVDGHALVEAP